MLIEKLSTIKHKLMVASLPALLGAVIGSKVSKNKLSGAGKGALIGMASSIGVEGGAKGGEILYKKILGKVKTKNLEKVIKKGMRSRGFGIGPVTASSRLRRHNPKQAERYDKLIRSKHFGALVGGVKSGIGTNVVLNKLLKEKE